uniref:Kinesin-like protein n=1 Tax=Salix viminalis TaxID=40686 RepID=A0A6N2MX33_SALVM
MEAPPSPSPASPATNGGEDCCVKVAVHIRPLIADERAQGCKDCVTVVSGKPQVQIGTHSFTFDHVYGSSGTPSSAMFEDCIAPLVDGLFQGYNATVLAYGQTGSGKTYTMGTGFKDGFQMGIIPQVMNVLFRKIETLKHQTEFQLHVSFIERDFGVKDSERRSERFAGSCDFEQIRYCEWARSRSHAIFTITLEQMRKLNPVFPGDSNPNDSMNEEYLCAKLHLVDLAGSERAKRTGSDGMRFKEGVHINKGLLALGNVISALGDEKKRKEGVHVPYRDSKLTRLLQVNRDPMSSEMLKMRQQLEYLQAELFARGGGCSSDEVQVLDYVNLYLSCSQGKDCLARSCNETRELHEYRGRCTAVEQRETDAQDGSICSVKTDGLKRSLHSIESPDYQMGETIPGDSREIDEEVAKEWEHTILQYKELHELNRRLEEKESEMKLFGGADTAALKQHFGKKIMELEDEKRTVQQERDRLLAEIENLSASSDGQKLQDIHAQKLKTLEAQIMDLKKKQENQVQILKQKQKSDEAAKRLQDEIQSMKAQKLRKEGRRNEYERHKLQAINQRQKMLSPAPFVVAFSMDETSEEAAVATKRLKELLEARKSSARDNSAISNGNGANGQSNDKSLQRWLDHELEVMVNVHEVRFEYEKQSQVRAALAEELAVLKQVDEFASKGLSPPRGKNGFARASSMSPNARMARKSSLENMLSISSNSLVAMASQLSEAEERERAFTNRGRWNQLRSMGDAKNLLQYMFNSLGDARCQLWEKEMEIKEMKEQFKELVGLLRQSESQRKEVEKELKLREQALAVALATAASADQEQRNSHNSLKHFNDDMSGPLSPVSVPAQKQLKYTPGIANGSVRESAAFIDQTRKMVPLGQLSMRKLAAVGQGGKLWRWKRSHHQWLLQFKWKWQKPWRLSELIRHSDVAVMRAKTRPQALPRKV